MPKTVTIQVDCPQCRSLRVKKLSEKEKWIPDEKLHIKIGRFECMSCGEKFNYSYGLEQE